MLPKWQNSMSASEVNDALSLHWMTVCRHLSILEREESMVRRREGFSVADRGVRISFDRYAGEEENQSDFQRHRNCTVPLAGIYCYNPSESVAGVRITQIHPA